MRCQPLFDADGTPDGLIATFDDATERVRAEQALRAQLALIETQSETIRTLGSPVLSLWNDVLCLPVIGLVDDARAAALTETLLEAIVRERARFAIIDLTGVESVDTSTAQHLVQLFRAVTLVGAEAILTGLRPAVAQTVTSLGIDMARLPVKRSLHKALEYCFARSG
jgi:rsbT co-antagonist protein RsbR